MNGLRNPRLVRAVLFDLDGTLVVTPIDFAHMRAATLECARRHGADTGELEGLDALTVRRLAGRTVLQRDAFEADVEQILTEIELAAAADARAAPGAGPLLEWLEAAGIAIGIVTRNCGLAAEAALRRSGLPWKLLMTRQDVPRVKPDPVHLLMAVERLGVPPSGTVMIGDHPMDVAGGRAAGMRTIGYGPTGEARARLAAAGPDGIVSHLEEIPGWISRW